MNEYRNASNLDQPFTRPVAFRRNRVGASLTAAIDPPLGASAVHELVVLHLVLPRVDRDDRRLEDALLVRAPRVQRQRLADPRRALALVDVTVEGEHRLEPLDRVADRRRTDRLERLTA